MPTTLKRANVKVKVNGQFQDLGLLQSDVATQLADEIATRQSNDNSLEANKIPYPQNPDSKYGNPGDILRTDGAGGTKWVPVGQPTDEQTQDAINNWLDEHPEATTTVEDHSLTYEKLVNGTLGFVTPEMFGAKGDGFTDDTLAVQAALDSGKNVYINSNYNITDPGLVLNVDNIKVCGSGKLIKLQSTPPDTKANSYSILTIQSDNNIIEGFTIEGDRLTYTGTFTEFRHCLRVFGSNAKILNMKLLNAQGDGIVLGENIDGLSAVNALVEGCYIYNVRRNGISIINSFNFQVSNTTIDSTNGTNPQFGIDIEPNRATQYAIGTIINVITKNNYRGGISIYDVNNSNLNIKISDCLSIDDGTIDSNKGNIDVCQRNSKGIVDINNCRILNYKEYGIHVSLVGTVNGNILFDDISIIGGGTHSAIRIYNSSNNDLSDLAKRVLISSYYCADITNELLATSFANLIISSQNFDPVGTIAGAKVVRNKNKINTPLTNNIPDNGLAGQFLRSNGNETTNWYDLIKQFNVPKSLINGKITFSAKSKFAIIQYIASLQNFHAIFLVTGYGEGATRNTIIKLDTTGSSSITLAVDGETNNFVFTSNATNPGIIRVIDFIGTCSGFTSDN